MGIAARYPEGDSVTGHGEGRDGHGLATRLSHAGRAGTKAHGFVNLPLHRGSTVLYESMAQRRDFMRRRFEQALTYGLNGSATHHALEDVVAEVEGGTRCQIVGTGLAACTTPLLAYLGAGDHCLVPDSVYGPVRTFCDTMLRRLGVGTTYYAPEASADELAPLIRPETKLLYLESPGSHSFEVQDVPALASMAHARGLAVLMDNTWGIHAFQPFAHGVDVSIQALTKYAVGHSDVLLGSITTREDAHWKIVRDAALVLGQYASPDDCWLTLRGMRTMAVRLERQMASGLEVAAWFAERPEVARVLHPALPGAPGHELWKRDFSGAASLFGVEFRPEVSVAATHRLVDALELFGIGASWGGYESLALPTTGIITRTAGGGVAGPMVRFHIGLEDPADLIADLEAGFRLLGETE
jgi:cystathionine beta-lyase